MNVSVILGHPYDGSFNAAIAQTVVQTLEEDGHAVAFHDLHAEGFNPVIPPSELVSDVPADDLTALHQREIKEAESPRGARVQHVEHAGSARARSFRRSAAAAVARLHLRLLRRDHVRSGYVPRRCRQHAGRPPHVA